MAKVIGCKDEKDCENPLGCCATCYIGFANCKNEKVQCCEVPDTCNLKILDSSL